MWTMKLYRVLNILFVQRDQNANCLYVSPFFSFIWNCPKSGSCPLGSTWKANKYKTPTVCRAMAEKMHFARVDVADEGSYDHLQESEKPRDVVFVFFISFLPPLHWAKAQPIIFPRSLDITFNNVKKTHLLLQQIVKTLEKSFSRTWNDVSSTISTVCFRVRKQYAGLGKCVFCSRNIQMYVPEVTLLFYWRNKGFVMAKKIMYVQILTI